MHGGQPPVTGALLQLYAVGTTGDKSSASPQILATLTTSDGTGNAANDNANIGNAFNTLPKGAFIITDQYHCPSNDAQVYLVGTGGNPGLGANVNNPALAMVSVLGPCGNLSAATNVEINELTTIGSLAPIAPYMSGYANLGSGAGDLSQFLSALALVQSYTDTTHGTVPGPGLAPGFYASSVEVATLADILAACINSDGTGVCQQLFDLATPPGGVRPTDTIAAAVDILNNPTNNAAALFALVSPGAPFQPVLAAPPAAWSLPIVPNAATPVISPASGTYALAPSITISDATSGATIYYTTDNSTPTQASTVYSGSFNLAPSASTTRTVRAIASAPGFGPSATTAATYTLSAQGQGSALAFLTQPVDSIVNTTLPGVRVGIVDAYGTLVPDHFKSITLALAANPGSATLGGTLVGGTGSGDGSFTFTDLSLNQVANGYTLQATSGGYAAAVSTLFNVTPTPIVMTTPSTLIGSGRMLTGTFTLPQVAPSGGTTVTLSSSNTAAITIAPSTVTVAAGATSGSFTYTSVGVGTSKLRASAAGLPDGTVDETTTASFVSLGTLPTLAPGASGALAVTLNQPAPAGGVVVTLTSASTSVATVPSSVTIPSGATSPTIAPQVSAKTFGTTLLTAKATNYAPDTQTLTVAGTATLSTSVTMLKGLTASDQISLGTTAPSGGVVFTLKSDDTTIATVPATATVAAGQSTVNFTVTGVGVGTTTVHAKASGIPDATSAVAVTGGSFTLKVGNTAAHTYVPAAVTVSASAVSPVSVTVTSNNPAVLLLSLDPNVAGTASITVSNFTGSSLAFYEQGQAAGSTTVTATSSAYTTTSSGLITVYAPTVIMQSTFATPLSSTTTSATINLVLAALQTSTPVVCSGFNTAGVAVSGCRLNPGSSFSIGVTSSSTAVGTITASPVTFNAGDALLTTQFVPVGAGSTTVSLGTQPSGFSTPSSTYTSFVQQVAQPTFTLPAGVFGAPGVTTIINGTLSLAETNPGGATVTVTSSNPAAVVITTSPTGTGTASVTLPGVASALPTLYFQGLAAGTSTITVSATGYKTVTMAASITTASVGFSSGSNVFVNTSDSPYPLTLILNVGPGFSCYVNTVTNCFITPGTANTFPVISQDTSIATLTDFTFAPLTGFATGTLQGQAAGQTVVLIGTTPAPFAQRAAGYGPSQLSVFVTQSKITTQPVNTGVNLTWPVSTAISAPGGGTRTVSIASGNGAVAVISTNVNVLGTAVATIPNFAGGALTYYVQGISPGTTTLTVSAPGYTTTPVALTVLPSGVVFLSGGGTLSTTTQTAPTTLTAYLAMLNASTGAVANYCGTSSCQLNPGLSLTANVTSSNTTTGTISTSALTFTPANVSATTTFVPNEVGFSTLAISQPSGFTAGTFSSGVASVSGPTFSVPDITTGAGFYTKAYAGTSNLPASGGISITVTLADPTLAKLSLDPAVMGTASSLTFNNVTGVAQGTGGPPPFYIQGVVPGYTKLHVTAHGYTPYDVTVAIYKAGFTLFSASTSLASDTVPTSGTAKLGAIISLLDPYSNSVVSDCLAGSTNCGINPGATAPTFSVAIADPTIGVFAPVSNAYDTSLGLAYLPYTGLTNGMTTFSLATQSTGLYNTSTAGRKMGIATAVNKGDATYALVIESHDIDAGVGMEVVGNESLSGTTTNITTLQVTVTIADPTIAVLSNSATVVGGSSISLQGLNYVNNNFYVQGLKAGTTTITFTGPLYQSRTITVTVRPAGFVFRQFDFVRGKSNGDGSVTVTPAILNDAGQWLANAQVNPQAGTSLQVTSSQPGVGAPVSSTVTFAAGATSGTFNFHSVAAGTTTLTLGAATGFVQPTTYQSVNATVYLP